MAAVSSTQSSIQASLQGVIDALGQNECKKAKELLTSISAIDGMQRGFMGNMLMSSSVSISDKIKKIVEMADKRWKIQLKAPDLAGRAESKAPAKAPVPQAAVARALPASVAVPTKALDERPSILAEVQRMAQEVGFTKEEIALRIHEVRVGDTPFCIVGTTHREPKIVRLEQALTQRALQKKLVCLEEGLLRNSNAERLQTRMKFRAADPGYYFGLESEINHAIFTSLNLLTSTAGLEFKISTQQEAVVRIFFTNPTFSKYVKELALTGSRTANEFVTKAKNATAQTSLDAFQASITSFNDPNEWLTFVCKLAEVVLAKGRSEPMQEAVRAYIQYVSHEKSQIETDAIKIVLGTVDFLDVTAKRGDKVQILAERLVTEIRKYRDPEYAAMLVKMGPALPAKFGVVVMLGFKHIEGTIANLRLLEEAKSTATDEKKA